MIMHSCIYCSLTIVLRQGRVLTSPLSHSQGRVLTSPLSHSQPASSGCRHCFIILPHWNAVCLLACRWHLNMQDAPDNWPCLLGLCAGDSWLLWSVHENLGSVTVSHYNWIRVITIKERENKIIILFQSAFNNPVPLIHLYLDDIGAL